MRITSPIHDAFLQQVAKESGGERLGEVLTEVVGGRMAGRLSRNQLAARAWFSVNGSVERQHTCGVYLRKSRSREAAPVLVVYVDTSSRVTDFRTNKELYLARLANGGFAISDLDFRLSREGSGRRRDDTASVSAPHLPGSALPALSDDEEGRVARLTSSLPDGLRQSAARAMASSLRRGKTRKTQSDT